MRTADPEAPADTRSMGDGPAAQIPSLTLEALRGRS